jgi:hypothetical protein
MRGEGVDIAYSPVDGFRFRVPKGFPWGSKYAFGLAQPAGNTARIYPGTLWIHGIGYYTTAQTDVSLTSSPDAYVYLSHTKDHSTNSIPSPAIATLPSATAGNAYQFLLYKFTVVSGTSYRLTKVYHGGHDIHLAAVLR